MQPLDAVIVALFDCHYVGLVLTWESGVAKKKKKRKKKGWRKDENTIN